MTTSTATTTTTAATSTAAISQTASIMQPNVQLNVFPITADKVEVLGIAAFMEIGLARGNVKYTVENGRLRYTEIYKFLSVDIYSPFRTIKGASSEDLNFLEEEIPKFICWYVWDNDTQTEACDFFKNVVIKGLESLKEAYDSTVKKDVQDRIDYWIKIITYATEKPVTKDNFTRLLNEWHSKNVSFTSKVKTTTDYLNEIDDAFGKIVKNLITKIQFQEINAIFTKQYATVPEKITAVEAYMDNLYQHFELKKKAVHRQRMPFAEWQQLMLQAHQ